MFQCACRKAAIQQSSIFGLALLVGNEYRFLDNGQKFAKAVPKSWRVNSFVSSLQLCSLGADVHCIYLHCTCNKLSNVCCKQPNIGAPSAPMTPASHPFFWTILGVGGATIRLKAKSVCPLGKVVRLIPHDN